MTFLRRILNRFVVYLFLLVMFLIEVEHGLFLGRLTFGQRAQGNESTLSLFVGEGRTT